MDNHAQFEIRSYASVIGNEIVSRWCPIAWQAFKDYRMNSMSFSSLELQILKQLVTGNKQAALNLAEDFGWLNKINDKLSKNRERIEMEEKLMELGLEKPW